MHWNSLFFRWKIQKISGEGGQPPPQTPPQWGGDTPPHTPPPRRLRRLDPRACGARISAPAAPRPWPPVRKSWIRHWRHIHDSSATELDYRRASLSVGQAVNTTSTGQYTIHQLRHIQPSLARRGQPENTQWAECHKRVSATLLAMHIRGGVGRVNASLNHNQAAIRSNIHLCFTIKW